MAYIYQIQNDINGKVYIGKTHNTIEKRFQQHLKDSNKKELENRPLYRAIRKYGKEHFHVSLIEETDCPEERERYWIEYYHSYGSGYNATIGGDGKPYIDRALVINTFMETKSITKTAKLVPCDTDTVSKILKENNLTDLINRHGNGKLINQYDLEGNFLKCFPSAKNAAKSLNKITATSNGAADHILQVCKGKRKTAYGYKWKFAEDETLELPSQLADM